MTPCHLCRSDRVINWLTVIFAIIAAIMEFIWPLESITTSVLRWWALVLTYRLVISWAICRYLMKYGEFHQIEEPEESRSCRKPDDSD